MANPVTMVEAFEFFGEAARPAMPQIRRVFKDKTYRGNMVTLCQKLGPVAVEAVPDLTALLDDESEGMVEGALEALKSIGPPAASALPRIGPFHTNSDMVVRMVAATASARIDNKPALAFPILLDGLQGRLRGTTKAHMTVAIRQPGLGTLVTRGQEAAAILLGELGPAASTALPALEERLQHTNRWVRLASAQAVWRISGTADKALPVLRAMD